ncbi:Orotidine 5'-phosphate decarboxylase OS=Lysinibacillus sphaericus OX=1421 GN=pyrF PE=3 SV=1 [Lysinibacillus sphaericus]
MNTKPILALDFPGEAEVFKFLAHFQEPLFVKIGMDALYARSSRY